MFMYPHLLIITFLVNSSWFVSLDCKGIQLYMAFLTIKIILNFVDVIHTSFTISLFPIQTKIHNLITRLEMNPRQSLNYMKLFFYLNNTKSIKIYVQNKLIKYIKILIVLLLTLNLENSKIRSFPLHLYQTAHMCIYNKSLM